MIQSELSSVVLKNANVLQRYECCCFSFVKIIAEQGKEM